eukprot:m.130458 g.130458  ORF g.130458 m.130458 type:complete len:483 (+) comp29481_c0_seq1:107-1555(+)
MSNTYNSLHVANSKTAVADGGDYGDVSSTALPGILDFASTAEAFEIDWATYKQSHFLDDVGLELITSFVGCKNNEEIETLLNQRGQELFEVLIGMLSKVSKLETLQYLLTAMMKTIELNRAIVVPLFHKCSKSSGVPSWQAFLRILSTKDDPYVVHQAARAIIAITTDGDEVLPQREQQVFFMWLCNETKSKEKDASLMALMSLCKFLKCQAYRRSFYEHAEGITTLKHVFRLDPTNAQNIQAQYLAAYCIWVITFDVYVANRLQTDGSDIAKDVADLLRNTRKEKVARMCLAFFKNMLFIPDRPEIKKKNATEMVGLKLLPAIESIIQQGNADVDAAANLKYLKEELTICYDEMSTFDEYTNEVTSGRLEWSPVHRSDRFWRENAMRLNEDQYKLIKILIQLLETSVDPLVLAVAAHDIGQYVRCYPQGKKTIEKLRGKTHVMKLMHHSDQNVRRESLIAVQKMMTQNWSSLGKTLPGAKK